MIQRKKASDETNSDDTLISVFAFKIMRKFISVKSLRLELFVIAHLSNVVQCTRVLVLFKFTTGLNAERRIRNFTLQSKGQQILS